MVGTPLRPSPKSLVFDEFAVAEWHPTPDPKDSKPEHVCMILKLPTPVDGGEEDRVEIVVRFKTREVMDFAIAALQRHRDNVWPM